MSDVRRATTGVEVIRVRAAETASRPDTVVTEEPMEIRAEGPGQDPVSVAVTMRTPGHDFELAVGFLYTEGLIAGHGEVAAVKYCELPDGQEQKFNIVTVSLTRPWDDRGRQRAFAATASCGTCGKASIDQVEVVCRPLPPDAPFSASLVGSLPARLREQQRLFDQTGGLHGAAIIDRDGTLGWLREDVGRHNAVDKVVGQALLSRQLPLHGQALVVSGRLSFEIVQKAAVAGIPLVAAVSAPSSLAVDAADRLGVTIAAFVRDGGFNLYTHPERIDLAN